jgi:hypothetical protein
VPGFMVLVYIAQTLIRARSDVARGITEIHQASSPSILSLSGGEAIIGVFMIQA